jgi:hypothetical protein
LTDNKENSDERVVIRERRVEEREVEEIEEREA